VISPRKRDKIRENTKTSSCAKQTTELDELSGAESISCTR